MKPLWFARLTRITGAVVVCLESSSAFAFRSSPPAGRTGSPASGGLTCAQCHSDPTGAGSVQLLGAPATYQADQVYGLRVRVHDPTATRTGAGFEVSVEDGGGQHVGSLIVLDPTHTQFHQPGPANWIHHTATGVNNSIPSWSSMSNAAEYILAWQAPSSDLGPVTFWVVGNAINNNGQPDGDKVYATNVTATFDPAPIVPTVSTWGLVTLAELVLIAGTLLTARR
jgi:hypothetical protein